ncbi:hypothetical protein JMJ55_23235 [Belnapia sp. T6]|uniref:DUF6602 domain-containing protein n=1 Tax=Belnapia mucosa TaxID=2804532 RepID=A0ABS1VAT8_9PROT|nr:DUF6602 domain-containing protein [Belnapia mucosa]MBL6458256.1 hypothetical protein [Belnapia mucosa]
MPIDLKKKISTIETRLRTDLEEARASLEHAGNKDTVLEKSFRKYLREHLPRNLDVGEGEIIDTHGHCVGETKDLGQIDVIIVDEAHPAIYSRDQPATFLIEGVVAAGEVKSVLTSSEFKNVLKKSQAFKRLFPKIANGTQVFGNENDIQRFVDKRPYFLFAYESQITLEYITQTIQEYCASEGIGNREVLDAVFCLDRGSIIDFDDGNGAFQFLSADGVKCKGWQCPSSDSIMVNMLGWISCVMPKIQRFDAILPYYIVKHK